MVSIFGILNITRDSFSDGGCWLRPEDALAHARRLLEGGASVVDVGAESTHPDSEDVSESEEIDRLEPVVTALVEQGVEVSVDTFKPGVMAAASRFGAGWLNDVAGFRSEESVAAAAESQARLVCMFARSHGGRAVRRGSRSDDGVGLVVDEAERFFVERLETLTRAGVAEERIVLDPGMGFFLGPRLQDSIAMMQGLAQLERLGRPLLVSVSRKSFLGELTGRSVGERGAATLAAELWLSARGVGYIRTHDPAALSDGIKVWRALEAEG
jgi:dihydropteroate synthase type 2